MEPTRVVVGLTSTGRCPSCEAVSASGESAIAAPKLCCRANCVFTTPETRNPPGLLNAVNTEQDNHQALVRTVCHHWYIVDRVR